MKKNDNKINCDKGKRQEQKIGKSITLNYHQRQMIKNIVQKSMDFQKHKQEKAAATFASDSSNSDNHDTTKNLSEIGISSSSIPEKSGDYFLFDYRCALLHISARKALKKGKLGTARNFYKLFLYEWSGDRLDTSIAHTYFLWAFIRTKSERF